MAPEATETAPEGEIVPFEPAEAVIVEGCDATGVVTLAPKDCGEIFAWLAVSNASTLYVYDVLGETVVSVYEAATEVPIFVPFLYILYPATATLSVEAVQVRLT